MEEEHQKVIFNLEKKNKETIQTTEIRLETDNSVLRNKVTVLEKEKISNLASISELKQQQTYANDTIIDQNRNIKTLKDRIEQLESMHLKDQESKITLERDLAVEKASQHYTSQQIQDTSSEVMKLRVKIEESELSKKLVDVDCQRL